MVSGHVVFSSVLYESQIKGETKLPAATPTASNGAEGISDLEGKATTVGASEWSRGDASDRDGQTEGRNGREHMSQRGQRMSFK